MTQESIFSIFKRVRNVLLLWTPPIPSSTDIFQEVNWRMWKMKKWMICQCQNKESSIWGCTYSTHCSKSTTYTWYKTVCKNSITLLQLQTGRCIDLTVGDEGIREPVFLCLNTNLSHSFLNPVSMGELKAPQTFVKILLWMEGGQSSQSSAAKCFE